MHLSRFQKLLAECLGTALLLAVVVGSGIMGETLAQGNAALALLANSVATAAALFVLIMVFAPLSGAHFNPLVSAVAVLRKELTWQEGACFCVAQLFGACIGVLLAHAMFDLNLLQTSLKVRSSTGLWLAEGVATFGLLLIILRLKQETLVVTASCVALYIGSAYWFTASTAFANPAVTLARSLSNTFAGIAPVSVCAFVLAQCVGAALAYGCSQVWDTATSKNK